MTKRPYEKPTITKVKEVRMKTKLVVEIEHTPYLTSQDVIGAVAKAITEVIFINAITIKTITEPTLSQTGVAQATEATLPSEVTDEDIGIR